MALSALDDPGRAPTDEQARAALGGAADAWDALRTWLKATGAAPDEAWEWAGKSFGWSLRALSGDRAVAYLVPQRGVFLVGLVLGDRAVAASSSRPLAASTRALIDAARRYAEGTGFRLPVASVEDLADVRTLVELQAAR